MATIASYMPRQKFADASTPRTRLNEGKVQVDLIDVVRASIRRWYILLPLLAITGVIAHNYYVSVKPVYYSQAVVGIAPSNLQTQYTADGTPVFRNGLLDVGGPTLIANLAVLG